MARRLRAVDPANQLQSAQIAVGITGYDVLRPCGTFDAYRRHAARGEVCSVCEVSTDQPVWRAA